MISRYQGEARNLLVFFTPLVIVTCVGLLLDARMALTLVIVHLAHIVSLTTMLADQEHLAAVMVVQAAVEG